MEFSLSSLCIQEPSSGAPTSELRPLPKVSQGPQALKPTQGSRSSSLDALGPARKEDEAPFWKINAERSREGPEAGFQSLTPSQIKSMEKGEKVLPACYRQEQWVLPSVNVDRERPPPAQATSGMLPEDQLSEPLGKPLSLDTTQDEDSALGSEPTPTQVGGPCQGLFCPGASSRGSQGGPQSMAAGCLCGLPRPACPLTCLHSWLHPSLVL